MIKVKNNKGFTLTELLVSIAIIGILAGITLTLLTSPRERARDARRISELHNIEDAVNLFFVEKGYAPTAIYSENFDPLDPDKDYIEKIFDFNIPRDPKTGDMYEYVGFIDGGGRKRYCLRAQLENVDEDTPSCVNSTLMNAGGYVLQGP